MLQNYKLGAEPVHNPGFPRLSLKIPKKIWNDGVDRNIALHEAKPQRLCFFNLQKKYGMMELIEISQHLNPNLQCFLKKYQKHMG